MVDLPGEWEETLQMKIGIHECCPGPLKRANEWEKRRRLSVLGNGGCGWPDKQNKMIVRENPRMATIITLLPRIRFICGGDLRTWHMITWVLIRIMD